MATPLNRSPGVNVQGVTGVSVILFDLLSDSFVFEWNPEKNVF